MVQDRKYIKYRAIVVPIVCLLSVKQQKHKHKNLKKVRKGKKHKQAYCKCRYVALFVFLTLTRALTILKTSIALVNLFSIVIIDMADLSSHSVQQKFVFLILKRYTQVQSRSTVNKLQRSWNFVCILLGCKFWYFRHI